MAELYNATGTVSTLIGNWQEEARLLEATGTSRCKMTNTGGNAGGRLASSALHEPTQTRVIAHTEHTPPSNWQTHTAETYQAPAGRSDVLSYPRVPSAGPRQVQELQQLWQQAQVQSTPPTAAAGWETTYASEFATKTMDGVTVGTRVMRPPGGDSLAPPAAAPAAGSARDPVFLQESGICPVASRLMARGAPMGHVRGATMGAATGGLTSSSIDPAVPITMYTEAAAKASYAGTFYGTATLGKGLISRNDQFTKPMSDVNKQQQLL